MTKPNPYCPFCHGTGRKRVQITGTGGSLSEVVACPCHAPTPASNSESRKREQEKEIVDHVELDEPVDLIYPGGGPVAESVVSDPPTPPITVKNGPEIIGATMKISATTFSKVKNPGAALLHHVEALLMSVNAAGARADYITLNVEGQK